MAQPRKPRQLKLLTADPVTGRDSRDKAIGTVANVPRLVPELPKIIAEDPLAVECWEMITPVMQLARLLHAGSTPLHIGTCTSYAAYCRAVRDQRGGRVTARNLGEMSRDLRAWLGQCGMTAATEDLLAKAAEQILDEDDPFA